MVKGYKAFNQDMTNRYGIPFSVGHTYQATGAISFGNNGNGFHMCKNLCDVFRFFPCFEQEIKVAEVTGAGQLVRYDDEYNGYYDMYAVEILYIKNILTRDNIISSMLMTHELNLKKFLMTFSLTEEEKRKFLQKYYQNKQIISWLLYYQYGRKDAFTLNSEQTQLELRKVLTYGQNNN